MVVVCGIKGCALLKQWVRFRAGHGGAGEQGQEPSQRRHVVCRQRTKINHVSKCLAIVLLLVPNFLQAIWIGLALFCYVSSAFLQYSYNIRKPGEILIILF